MIMQINFLPNSNDKSTKASKTNHDKTNFKIILVSSEFLEKNPKLTVLPDFGTLKNCKNTADLTVNVKKKLQRNCDKNKLVLTNFYVIF